MEKAVLLIFQQGGIFIALGVILFLIGAAVIRKSLFFAGIIIFAVGIWCGLIMKIHSGGTGLYWSMLLSLVIMAAVVLFFYIMAKLVPNPELKKK